MLLIASKIYVRCTKCPFQATMGESENGEFSGGVIFVDKEAGGTHAGGHHITFILLP